MSAGQELERRDSASVVIVEEDLLDVTNVIAQHERIKQAMGEVMIEGHHYGMVYDEKTNKPAFKKPMLLKPGAEMLCKLFRFRPHYEEVGSVHKGDLIGYRVRCTLTHFPTGYEVAEGMASCNSREKRYHRWVNGQRQSPVGDEVWDLDNTILKVATKRALHAAILVGTAADDIFASVDDKTTTDWHKLLNARAAELDKADPREDGRTWADWSRDLAKERWGVESRSELDAEQLEELCAAMDAEVIPFD